MNEELLTKAYQFLSQRDHSVFELKQKLLRKSTDRREIEEVIAYLKEQTYLNDRVFTEKYVRYKSSINPVGPHKLRFELRKKGVKEEYIDHALSGDSYDELTLARDCLIGKTRLLNNFSSKQSREKLFRFLKNRGFTVETIYKVMESC